MRSESLAAKEINLLRYGTGVTMLTLIQHLNERVIYLDQIVHFSVSHNDSFTKPLDSNKQAGPWWMRSGYQEAKRELANLQKGRRASTSSLQSSE